jgi:hypothetical protein
MAFALEHVAPMEKPEAVERMRRGMSELRKKVGSLKISVNKPDVEVIVNGQSVGRAPLTGEVFVDPGKSSIEARSSNAPPATQSLDVVAGQTYSIELQIAEATVPAAVPNAAPATLPIATGSPASTPTASHADQPPARPAWPLYVGGGAALVGVSMAIGFQLSANAAESDLNALKASGGTSGCVDGSASAIDCAARRDAIDRHNSRKTWSGVGLAIGITGGVATLAYLVFWPNKKQSSGRLQPVLVVDRSTSTLRLTGSF